MGIKLVVEIKCDRCGKVIHVDIDRFARYEGINSIHVKDDIYAHFNMPTNWKKYYGMIFCPNCLQEFYKFMGWKK